MRIISGKLKGRKLIAPKKIPARPTTDRAKKALFDILENKFNITNIRVLDLYSGTGNISYEFASRGCKKIVAIDRDYQSITYIEKMKKDLNLNIQTLRRDVLNSKNHLEKKFDVIFADPPYNYDKYQDLIKLFLCKEILTKNGCLIIEHHKKTQLKQENIELRKYGDVNFSIFHL
ncbi:MAG: 16S rRNA (guanine(966)-N(2))-methyltransferase RsmD [Bacteroidota bacterium]|nr:16S rRNA (guanine(966)-N(2))-methyltransferase RsmD [Bacteroidota bacterium]